MKKGKEKRRKITLKKGEKALKCIFLGYKLKKISKVVLMEPKAFKFLVEVQQERDNKALARAVAGESEPEPKVIQTYLQSFFCAVQGLSRDPLESQGVQKNPRYIDKPHVVQILKIIFVYFKITIKGFEYVVRYKVFLFVVFILYDSRLGG